MIQTYFFNYIKPLVLSELMQALSIKKKSLKFSLMIKARILRETIYKTGRCTLQEVDTKIETDSRPIAATKSSLQAVFNPEYAKLRSACNDVGSNQEGSGWVI